MRNKLHTILTLFIALVWLINGLVAKVLVFAPRHEKIVARILGSEHSLLIIKLIGFGEIFLAIWILTRIYSRISAVLQIISVAAMNVLEFLFAKDLLMWGGLNALFAFIFICVIYYNEFVYLNNYQKIHK